jgi:hypothetical protein
VLEKCSSPSYIDEKGAQLLQQSGLNKPLYIYKTLLHEEIPPNEKESTCDASPKNAKLLKQKLHQNVALNEISIGVKT